MWNLLLGVLGYTEVPLSQAYGLPAQHKARPSGALSGEPDNRPPLKGEGDRRRRWRGSYGKWTRHIVSLQCVDSQTAPLYNKNRHTHAHLHLGMAVL